MNGSIRRQKIEVISKRVNNLEVNTHSTGGMYYTEVNVSDMIPTGYKIGAVTIGDWGGVSKPTAIYTIGNKVGIFTTESTKIYYINFVILLCRS